MDDRNDWDEIDADAAVTKTRPKPVAPPRYCPRCDVDEDSGQTLCGGCGDALVAQGYCGICERYWRKPTGEACPKHDLALDPSAPPSPFDGDARWVTVGVFGDTQQAEAPRIRLEAEGIPAFIEGSRMGAGAMYRVAVGGVRLQVPESLTSEARVILAQSWRPVVVDDEWEDLDDEEAAETGLIEPGTRAVGNRKVIATLLVTSVLIVPIFQLLSYLLQFLRSH